MHYFVTSYNPLRSQHDSYPQWLVDTRAHLVVSQSLRGP